jgi:aryl-alcohol dehydrogenase-like predicted oxidoreductase
LERVNQLAEESGASANQVALAYLMCHPFPVVPILGTGDVDHLRDALGAVEVELTPQQLGWLRDG